MNLELTDEAAQELARVRAEINDGLMLDLTEGQVASMLIRRGATALRKPATEAATAARRGRTKHQRKEVPCACKCGELVTTPDINGEPRKFRQGHSSRVIRTTREKRKPEEIPCACECGGTVMTPNKHGRNVRYIHGHHGKRKLKDVEPPAPAPAQTPVRPPMKHRKPRAVEKDPAVEVVWSGRDPLTPTLDRLAQDQY